MMWLSENAGTLVVALGLAIVCSFIVLKLVKDKKRGKSSCGCGCENCAMSGKCRNTDDGKSRER